MNLKNLIFLDTETTGVEKEDRLCQVAYIFDGKENNNFFKPPLPIKAEASAISHITNDQVKDCEVFENSKMAENLQKILPENILVAHNARFDIDMLKKENLEISNFIDTLKVAQVYDKEGYFKKYSMQYLRYEMNLDVKGAQAHDALGDILVLEKLFMRLFEKRKKEGLAEGEILEEMMEISKNPILIKKISFGKYTGKSVEEILKEDKGYLEWLLAQKEKQAGEGNVDEDWLFTLKKYLK